MRVDLSYQVSAPRHETGFPWLTQKLVNGAERKIELTPNEQGTRIERKPRSNRDEDTVTELRS